jgi:uncharacterized protein (DUF983 family)
MHVTRNEIILRGLTQRCPNCGGRRLFLPGKPFTLALNCPDCGLKLERDEGSFLGSVALNYGVTVTCFLTPIALAWYLGWIPDLPAEIMAVGGALLVPILLYRSARSWWLANYYVFLPHHLPANRDHAPPSDADDND